MTQSLKTPEEQRSFAAREAQMVADAAGLGRLGRGADGGSGGMGDGAVNLDEVERYGNLRQNMTARPKVMDR